MNSYHASKMVTPATLEQYERLKSGTSYATLNDRAWIELSGKDRQTFLHNLCTADIKSLPSGSAVELFILDTRGKTFGFGHVFALEDRLVITMASQEAGAKVCEHLDRYLIREDVEIADRSNEMQLYFVADGGSETELSELQTEPGTVSAGDAVAANLIAANIELAGPGFLLAIPKEPNENVDTLDQWLTSKQITVCTDESFSMHRLEQGTPWFGHEIDETNLPQELRRDAKAISFTKGCYLGQETVAKIDAFGHVNRFLVGMQIECDESEQLPESDSLIMIDDKKVGILKSTAYSPQLQGWLGLGFVKCKMAEPGTVVSVGSTNAKIIELPLA